MSASDGFDRPRMVTKKFLAEPQHEGDSVILRKCIGCNELRFLDPFLSLDEFSVSAPAGFPDHPHRGFETVTYMLQGAFTYIDFRGHKGTLHTGDVQWMTAGRGIIHSEMPIGEGTQKGLQLWINLSSKHKMIEPKYREVESKDIKCVEKGGVTVRILSGESMGEKSANYTKTPTMLLDFTMKPRTQMHQTIPQSWNAFVYVLEGRGVFGIEKTLVEEAHHVLVLSHGDGLSVWNESDSKILRFLLVAGEPIGEAVAQHGPFVMNTQKEIDEAIEDYRFRRNGFELGKCNKLV